jgi:hypothetical protein
VEEPDLGGVHSSGAWLDEYFDRRFGSHFRHRLFSVRFDYGFQLEYTLVGENKSAFSDKLVRQDLELRHGSSESFFIYWLPVVEIEIFHVSVKGLHLQGDGFFHNGVFTDDQFSSSF